MVPEGWKESQLGDVIAEFRGGGTPSRKQPTFWGGPIPWASVKDLNGGRLTRTIESITQEGLDNSSASVVPAGTVVLATRMAVGKAVTADVRLAINQDLKGLLPGAGLDSPYLQAWLNWREDAIAALASGTTVKGIRLTSLRSLPLALPPLPEQRKIAAILSSVDEAIAATRKVIAQTKRVKQGLLQTIMTRGIGHSRFKKTEIGEIPVAWDLAELGAVTDRVTDGTHQSVTTADDGAIPFLYVSSIRDGRIDMESAASISEATYAEISRGREPFKGLVLYTAVGSYGHAAVVPDDRPLAFQRHVAYVAPKKGRIRPDYLAGFLNSAAGRREADRFAVGNAQKTVTLRDLRQFRMPVPPIEEQQAIMSAVDSVQREEEIGDALIERLAVAKRGLMQDLLTGRVRVQLD